MLSGKQVFSIWLSMNNHFKNKGYDITAYKNPIKVKDETFMKRKDKKLFQMAKFDDYQDYVIWHLVYVRNEKKTPYILDLIEYKSNNPKAKQVWLNWTEGMKENIKEELSYLAGKYSWNILVYGKQPKLLNEVLSGKVSLELFVLIGNQYNLWELWDKDIHPIIWKQYRNLLYKYSKFINNRNIREIVGKYYEVI